MVLHSLRALCSLALHNYPNGSPISAPVPPELPLSSSKMVFMNHKMLVMLQFTFVFDTTILRVFNFNTRREFSTVCNGISGHISPDTRLIAT